MEIAFGQAVPKAALVKLFEDFLNFVNLGKTMDSFQLVQTVELILEYYKHLSLLDFKLFFKRLKLGDYGKFYDRVDGAVILDGLIRYTEEKASIIRNGNSDYHIQNKGKNILEKAPVKVQDVIIEAFKEKDKEISTLFKPNYGDLNDLNESRIKTESEIRVNRWIKQFDNLYYKFGVVNGIRYLKINNQLFTFDKFIERKFENYER